MNLPQNPLARTDGRRGERPGQLDAGVDIRHQQCGLGSPALESPAIDWPGFLRVVASSETQAAPVLVTRRRAVDVWRLCSHHDRFAALHDSVRLDQRCNNRRSTRGTHGNGGDRKLLRDGNRWTRVGANRWVVASSLQPQAALQAWTDNLDRGNQDRFESRPDDPSPSDVAQRGRLLSGSLRTPGTEYVGQDGLAFRFSRLF